MQKERIDFDYFQLRLYQFLQESHPDRLEDIAFVKSRALSAAQENESSLRQGMSMLCAEECAMKILFDGLHFSRYDVISEILLKYFSEIADEKEFETLAKQLKPQLDDIFDKYGIDGCNDFLIHPQYDLMQTEVIGAITLIFEKNGI